MRSLFVGAAGRRVAWALALYTLLALVLTWPLAAHFTTHVAGDGIDDPSLAWNLWWLKARLVDQLNPDIFHTGWMFHPVDINLAFYTLTPLNGLLSIPLQVALGLTAAANLLLLSSFVLSGLGAYLLVRESLRLWGWRGDAEDGPGTAAGYLGALLGGGIYAFASAKLFYAALGQFNIASSQWIPFCALYLVRMAAADSPRAKLRAAAWAGLFLVLQAWAELTYASFLLIFIALLFAWSLLFGKGLRGRLADAVPYLLVGAIFVLGLAPFLLAMAPDLQAEGDFFGRGGGFADVFSADLLGYLLPTRLHPFLGDWVAGLPFPNDKGQQIFVGYSVLLLAGVGAWGLWRSAHQAPTGDANRLDNGARSGTEDGAGQHPVSAPRRWLLFWGVTALLFWLLTLGPQLRWAGEPLPLPGPFAVVSQLPFFSGNRYPSRYSVMLLLAVAVLAGAGATWLLTRRRAAARRGAVAVACAAFAALVVFEHLSVPLPLSDQAIPPIYGALQADLAARTRGSSTSLEAVGTLLELPTGWRNGARVLGKSDLLIMAQQWYQTEHGLRRLGGNTSRNPEYKFQYFTDAPLLGDLIALFNADQPHLAPVIDAELDAMIARNQPLAAQVLDFLGVEYVTVHVEKSPPQLLRFVAEVLPLTLLDEKSTTAPDGSTQTIRLYQVNAEDAGGLDAGAVRPITMDAPLANLYLGAGWSPPAGGEVRYAVRSAPNLLVNVPAAGGRIVLEWAAPLAELEAVVNGQTVPVQALDSAGVRWALDVPDGVGDRPVDHINLRLAGPGVFAGAVAAPPLAEGWPVGATGAVLPAGTSLLVRSAGQETGDFAHIWVNGVDVVAGARGYNLAAIAPDGRVLGQATFDTLGAAEASGGMATWLRSWPLGTIIAGAVADEASLQLGADAVAALGEIGVSTDLRGKFRWSHAFVGAAGAPPGSAVEDASLLRPAVAAVGPPVDGPLAYGQLRALVVEPPPAN
jgi:hypothetical protein